MGEIVTIELFGERYSFKAESGVSDASEIADLLKKEVAEVEKQLSDSVFKMNKISILALAALNILSDYVELKKEHATLLENVLTRSTSLAERLDVSLQ